MFLTSNEGFVVVWQKENKKFNRFEKHANHASLTIGAKADVAYREKVDYVNFEFPSF